MHIAHILTGCGGACRVERTDHARRVGVFLWGAAQRGGCNILLLCHGFGFRYTQQVCVVVCVVVVFCGVGNPSHLAPNLRQEVHVVFSQIPGINTQGTAVQNPDGNIMYGAPYAGAPYAPPQGNTVV